MYYCNLECINIVSVGNIGYKYVGVVAPPHMLNAWLASARQLALKPNQPVTLHWGHLGLCAAMGRLCDMSSGLTLEGGRVVY